MDKSGGNKKRYSDTAKGRNGDTMTHFTLIASRLDSGRTGKTPETPESPRTEEDETAKSNRSVLALTMGAGSEHR
jgi:hypothetical protein